MIKNNLKKIDISKILSKKKGFSLPLSKKLTQDLINILILMIKNGKLNIKNLGSFKSFINLSRFLNDFFRVLADSSRMTGSCK